MEKINIIRLTDFLMALHPQIHAKEDKMKSRFGEVGHLYFSS